MATYNLEGFGFYNAHTSFCGMAGLLEEGCISTSIILSYLRKWIISRNGLRLLLHNWFKMQEVLFSFAEYFLILANSYSLGIVPILILF